MRYALLVALREYAENAKTKGFWIGILLFPALIVVAMQVPRILDRATPTRYFVVVDQSGDYGGVVDTAITRLQTKKRLEEYQKYAARHVDPDRARESAPDFEKIRGMELDPAAAFDSEKFAESLVESALGDPDVLDALATEQGWRAWVTANSVALVEDRPEFEEPRERFRKISLPTGVPASGKQEEIAESLRPYLVGEKKVEVDGESKKLFAAVIIPEDPAVVQFENPMANEPKEGTIEYWSANLADTDLRNEIRRTLNEEVRRQAYVDRGVQPEVVKQVQKTRVDFTSKNPKKAKGKEEVSLADTIRQWAPVAFVYLLFVAIMTVAQMLLNNTIEEKSNRIIEVLLSSVTAGELMMGKLLGIAAIGITMTGTWILSLFVVHKLYTTPEMEFFSQAFEVIQTSNLLPAFAVYFLLGYLFYAGIFLSIGSICNTLKDAQNFMGPVMLIMMVPLFTMMFIPKDPNGALASFLSWVPLYTPFIMMNRAAADPPMFDIVGTLILMVVSAAAMLWLSGKIFRTGILRTGQPPKLLELLRWVRN